jgi:hypothetical protein
MPSVSATVSWETYIAVKVRVTLEGVSIAEVVRRGLATYLTPPPPPASPLRTWETVTGNWAELDVTWVVA